MNNFNQVKENLVFLSRHYLFALHMNVNKNNDIYKLRTLEYRIIEKGIIFLKKNIGGNRSFVFVK